MAYPTAPPRFLPEWGFSDSVANFVGENAEQSANVLYNPFAAVPSMHGGGEEAEEHRLAFVEQLREEGLNIGGAKVGDPDPLAAIQDECNFNDYDELIVSTLPLHISKWLKVDLPRKAEAATGLPVSHVVGSS